MQLIFTHFLGKKCPFPCQMKRNGIALCEVRRSAMNHRVPEWSMEEDSRSIRGLPPSANHLKPTWTDDELVELLWQNGHAVMHSQTHRKTTTSPSQVKPCQKPESAVKGGPFKSSANILHEETSPWLQYPIDDSLEREFCPEVFYELSTTESPAMGKLKDIVAKGDKSRRHETAEENGMLAESVFEQSSIPQLAANMVPHRSEFVASHPQTTIADCGGDRNFPHFSRKAKGVSAPLNGYVREKRLGNQIQGEAGGSSSMMTKESSICASNQVHNWFGPSYTHNEEIALEKCLMEDAPTRRSHEKVQTDVHETTITSSSGGSGCTIGRAGQQSAGNRIHKRKGRDADESELQSEEAEYESMETSRQPQRSASARRRRAAEVHNLSERRRRDRINEKMRALQELIPHCNKSDKASMLDEAIEYLKSLQLQVQIMWMRSGLAPMMFLGVHHFMPQMGMGMGHISMPPIRGPIPFPSAPLVNQPVPSDPTVNQASFCPSLDINPLSFQNQMQNHHIPTPYPRYLGFQHMQPSPQMMNLYAYGAQLMQQNQAAAPLAANKCAPCTGDAPSENAQDGSTG